MSRPSPSPLRLSTAILTMMMLSPPTNLAGRTPPVEAAGPPAEAPGSRPEEGRQRWTRQQAWEWYEALPWLVGCNFIPSTAINQLEMWQADTFDPQTIDRELGWAAEIGFNTVRVYLHDLPWRQDSEGFLGRLDRFLEISDSHGIRPMLVLFDGVWDPAPTPGRQPDPRPHLHNSGWVQSPGAEILGDPGRHGEVEGYVRGVIRRFREDPRVLAWDLFNEPDNPNSISYGASEIPDKAERALDLLGLAFEWARDERPTQPLTAAVWRGSWGDPQTLSAIDRLMLEASDILTFHSYGAPDRVQESVEELEHYDRPMLSTEYLARGYGNTFESILPLFRDKRIGAYNWGLVSGKTQTIYPWSSWRREFSVEPEIWHHDIFRRDGSPYRESEAVLIRQLIDSPSAPTH